MLIAERNALLGEPPYTAKSYVQDGLVAMWDGIENAGWGQHDVNATAWKDLFGHYDATLTTAGSFSANSLICSGGEKEFPNSIPGAIGSTYIPQEKFCALEVVYRLTSKWGRTASTQGPQILFAVGGTRTSIRGGLLYWTKVGTDNITPLIVDGRSHSFPHAEIDTSDYFSIPLSVSVSYSSIISDAREAILFTRNAVSQPVVNWANTVRRNQGRVVSFGGVLNINDDNMIYGMNGDIYCCRLYSRPLTASEIVANYAVDKARFNLP